MYLSLVAYMSFGTKIHRVIDMKAIHLLILFEQESWCGQTSMLSILAWTEWREAFPISLMLCIGNALIACMKRETRFSVFLFSVLMYSSPI